MYCLVYAYCRSALQLHHVQASNLLRDLGSFNSAATNSSLVLATPDGMPLVGFHPGFEQGRVVVACCAAGGHGSIAGNNSASSSSSAATGSAAAVARGAHSSSAVPPPASQSTLLVMTSDPRRPLPPGGVAADAAGNAVTTANAADIADGAVDGASSWCSGADGYHLSPLLAKYAVDLLSGTPLQVYISVWAMPKP